MHDIIFHVIHVISGNILVRHAQCEAYNSPHMCRKFVLDLFVPNDVKPKMPLGVRFVLFEPSTDSWYPGGAGGNFYVPVAKEAKGDHRYV